MKKGWQTKTLGEVCEVFADGDWVESKDQSSEGIRLIQTGNVGEGVFKDRAEKARYISEATFKRLRCTEIVEGDCLVSRLPDPVGRSCILPDTGERMITAVDCTILRFNPKQLLPTFFNLYSQSDDYLTTVAKECTGTTRNRISRSNLGLTSIPVPPLAEQQRIVGLLDEAFEGLATAKANAEKNLQNARALFESHLQSVFTQSGPGWVEHTLGDLIEIQNGYAFKSNDYTDAGYFVIRISNVQDGEITLANPRFIKLADKKLERFILNDGDILISLTGNIGRVGIIQEDQLPAVLNQRVARITIKDQDADRSFLFRFLLSRTFRESLQEAGHGAAQQNVSTKEIEAVRLSLPNKKEQRRIVEDFDNFAEETQRLARLYERKHGALEALKKSLLHQAFTGEL